MTYTTSGTVDARVYESQLLSRAFDGVQGYIRNGDNYLSKKDLVIGFYKAAMILKDRGNAKGSEWMSWCANLFEQFHLK